MNITEFAEQIVFGTTLADKLLVPGRLTHEANRSRSPRVESLRSPVRPRGLEMKHGQGEKFSPPSDEQLEHESARGQLLHFLANHELLATELMALTLLKFPDAPLAFRQGVLVTLQEEQEHTRMYLRQMKSCGIEFGSFPLSGQFWRAVEPMQSPLDFVSRLSLTFEQANLDYSLHFAGVFEKIGDAETAQLLQKIYQDEIGHVQHGLHWFRQWKKPNQTDWDAYQEQLEFPLSPQRGRGPRGAFNRAGRIAAGLSEDFIDAIEVYRQSRGRAPSIRWFDPAAEIELTERSIFTGSRSRETSSSTDERRVGQKKPLTLVGQHPHTTKQNQLLDQLAIDLELAMVAMARQDDVMLVRRLPSRETLKPLVDAGFDLPEFVCFRDAHELSHRKLHDFVPWAWTPNNLAIAEPLIDSAHHAPPVWCDSQIELFRKSWSTNCLQQWLSDTEQSAHETSSRTRESSDSSQNQPTEVSRPRLQKNEFPLSNASNSGHVADWFCSVDCVGTLVRTIEEVPTALSKIAERGYGAAIAKTDLSSSGRGQRRLACHAPLSPQDTAWLGSVLAQPQALIIEPELNRVVDLSFLWHLPRDTDTANYLGWTRPLVTGGRRYAGTRLGTPLAGCDEAVKQFLLADRGARLQDTADWLAERIVPELKSRGFGGHFGIDAFVYREPHSAELKIKPLVELNPRTTMGHIAHRLSKQLSRGAEALFCILQRSQWERLHLELNQIPLQRASDGLTSGVIWLGEVTPFTKLVPVLLVGKRAVALLHLEAVKGHIAVSLP